MKYVAYSEEEINDKLKTLDEWSVEDNAIEKNFVLKNFSEALAFIVQIGIASEQLNHHAEIYNVYNKVKIRLNTHDVKGITDMDFKLATLIDQAFSIYNVS